MDKIRKARIPWKRLSSSLIIDTILYGVRFICGLRSYTMDFIAMAQGLHKVILNEHKGLLERRESYARAVVVAMYPSNHSIPFTINVMKGFAGEGFFVLGVSTKPLAPSMKVQLLPHCHCIMERFNMGYDFGSYQAGMRWIGSQAYLKDVDTLALANDSVFYPISIAETIRDLLAKDSNWMGLFENFDIHYHVQSFFEIFRRDVLTSKAFQDFWRSYRGFSSRVYAINHGEVGLSAALDEAGFVPAIAYSSEAIKQKVHVLLSENPNGSSLAQRIYAIKDRMMYLFDDVLDFSNVSIIASRIAGIAERSNPTHSVGLLCNLLFNAPIKCDLCSRGSATIADVLTMARGFSEAERDSMKQLLYAKGLPLSILTWRGLKRRAGVA